jgi:hypothetical protein
MHRVVDTWPVGVAFAVVQAQLAVLNESEVDDALAFRVHARRKQRLLGRHAANLAQPGARRHRFVNGREVRAADRKCGHNASTALGGK